MITIIRSIKHRIFSFFFNQKSNPPTKDEALLPPRQPRLANLRPGRQHCEIHDPDYLKQILRAELGSEAPPNEEPGPQSPTSSPHQPGQDISTDGT